MDWPRWRRRSAPRRQMRKRPTRMASRARRRGAGRSAASPAVEDGRGLRPSPKLSLCRNVRGWGQCAALDLAQDLVQLGLQLWRHSEVVDRVTGTLIGDAEGQRSGLELVVDDVLDRRVGRDVNLLEGAGDDGRVSVLLVGVDADAVDAGLAGLLQHAQPAAPCDL